MLVFRTSNSFSAPESRGPATATRVRRGAASRGARRPVRLRAERSIDPSMPRRAHVIVSGRVQGVGFRFYTRETARRCAVVGFVRNLPDGRVEAVFEGPDEAVESVVSWCRSGPPGSRVETVERRDEAPTGEFAKFDIER